MNMHVRQSGDEPLAFRVDFSHAASGISCCSSDSADSTLANDYGHVTQRIAPASHRQKRDVIYYQWWRDIRDGHRRMAPAASNRYKRNSNSEADHDLFLIAYGMELIDYSS